MNEAPRPLTLGEILDRTLEFYRSRFLLFFGISVIPIGMTIAIVAVIILLAVLASAVRPSVMQGAAMQGLAVFVIAAVLLVTLPVILGVTALAEAALNHAVNRAYYSEVVTIRAAYRAIWGRGWRYIWLYILQALAVWGPPVGAWFAMFVVAGLMRSAGAAAAIMLLFILMAAGLVGYCIWMALRLSLAFPACVIERSTAWAALKRSVALSKGTRGRIFLLYLLVFVLGYAMSIGLLIVVMIAMMLLPGSGSPQRQQSMGMIMVFVYYGANFAMQALTKPVYAIALMLFYYDQRIRLEGFDIEWMMQQAGMVVPALPDGAAPDAGSGTSVPAVTEQAQVATPVQDSDLEPPREPHGETP